MNQFRRIIVLIVAAVSLSFSLAQTEGGDLIVGMTYEPVTLDPHVTGQAIAIRILNNVFDTLVYADEAGELHPFLATSWEVSDDGLEYTFSLRDDVTFHDGTPFNAQAVQATFERIMDPATASQSAISALEPYESSEVIDDYTIRVVLSEPSAIWLRNIASGVVGIASPTAVAELGDQFARAPVGSGPFIITEWRDNESVTVVQNPDYNWAPEVFSHQGAPYLDSLVFRFIPEDQVRFGTLETGETTVIEDVPPLFVSFLEQNPDIEELAVPYPGSPRQFMINTQQPPTDELAVRKAILLAVDSQGMIDNLYGGVYPPGNGPMSAATYGATQGIYAEQYGYDPEAATQLLEEAGWTMGSDGVRTKDGERLTIVANVLADVPAYGEMTQAVQAQLSEVGMEVELKPLARSPWYASNAEGDYNIVGMALWSTDPNMLRMLYGTDGSVFTWSHYSNSEFDEMVNEGARMSDPESRLALYGEAQQMLMDDAVVLPIYDQVNILGKQVTVQDIDFDQNAYPRYYDTYFSE